MSFQRVASTFSVECNSLSAAKCSVHICNAVPSESTSYHSSVNVKSIPAYTKTIPAPTAIPAMVISMAFPGSGGRTASADAMYVSFGPYFPCEPDSPGLGAPFGAPVPPPLILDGAVDAGGCEVEDFFPPFAPPMMDVRVIT